MRLFKPAFLLVIAVILPITCSPAAVADKTSHAADLALPTPYDNDKSATTAGEGWRGPFFNSDTMRGEVCFTLRTYQVERAERFSDERRSKTSYTTCQVGSRFRFRSAVGDPETRK